MLTLVYDTETTGKCDFKRKNNPAVQPYMVQFAGVLLDEDDDKIVAEVCMITEPDFKGIRVNIPQEATNIHGINEDVVARAAFPYKVALPIINNLLKRADQLVCHNTEFDVLITKAAYCRIAAPQERILEIPKICTMKSSESILKLPGKYGYKWPSLDEAYRYFVDPDGFENAHDAMADTKACLAVYRELKKRGHILTH